MRKQFPFFAFAISISLLLTGCGASIPDMSEEEEQLVAQYAAHAILAKNKNYDTGLATEEEIAKADAKAERQRLREQEAKKNPEKEERTNADPSGNTENNNGTSASVQNGNLAEFLGFQNISIEYVSSELCDSYPNAESGDTYFAMDAKEGNDLLVLKFEIANTGAEDQEVDILYKYPLFRINVNGTGDNNALTTLLLDDLSTFKDTLAAGESRPVVLVTEITEEQAAEPIQSLDLSVKLNDERMRLQLQ